MIQVGFINPSSEYLFNPFRGSSPLGYFIGLSWLTLTLDFNNLGNRPLILGGTRYNGKQKIERRSGYILRS